MMLGKLSVLLLRGYRFLKPGKYDNRKCDTGVGAMLSELIRIDLGINAGEVIVGTICA